jgi:hypothetical protein
MLAVIHKVRITKLAVAVVELMELAQMELALLVMVLVETAALGKVAVIQEAQSPTLVAVAEVLDLLPEIPQELAVHQLVEMVD